MEDYKKKYCYNCILVDCENRLIFPDEVEPVNCENYVEKY